MFGRLRLPQTVQKFDGFFEVFQPGFYPSPGSVHSRLTRIRGDDKTTNLRFGVVAPDSPPQKDRAHETRPETDVNPVYALSRYLGNADSRPESMIHITFSNLKTWLSGTQHGVGKDHLQAYLDEFVFRFNRRFYPMTAFVSILGIGMNLTGPTYRELYGGKWNHHTRSSMP